MSVPSPEQSSRRHIIAVIGDSRAAPEAIALAEALGAALARAGLSLVCGGRTGVMAAACRGLCEARDPGSRAVTIGILPGAGREEANPYVDLVLPTGLGLARNTLVALAGDAVVAIGGGTGTLSEIAMAWQHGRPVFALQGAGGWAERLADQRLDWRRPTDRVEAWSDPERLVERIRCLLCP